jgi:predicted dehydrogenase
VRILIAGLGSIGRRHLCNLQALGVKAIVLLRSGHSTLPDTHLAGLPTEYDLHEALRRHHPTAVVVSNPTALHLDIAIPAAEAGCHLLLEKPISHSMRRVADLSQIVHERKVKLLVGFQFRFHPSLQLVKQLLDSGAFGRVTYVQVHWGEYLPDWHPWEDYRQSYAARRDFGGGVVLTLCHPFDYLRWLIGEVVSVSAMTDQLGGLDIEVEDTVNVNLRFACGALGTVHLDYVQRPPTHWWQITGQKGLIRWDSANGTVHCYRSETEAWEVVAPPPGFERNTMFLEEMRHFLDCIQSQREPLINLDDGIAALRIALAAEQSSRERKEIQLTQEM